MSNKTKITIPLVVIVGPTASGKTGLAIKIAKEYGGEILSADSRAIYKGLSIGTAKPSMEEREGIPHWGIDIVEPDTRFTVADFKQYANTKIAEIRSRGKIPILAGGTGLYVDAVIYNFTFPNDVDNTTLRDTLMLLTLEQLHSYCAEHKVALPENSKNKRYVVNSILRKDSAAPVKDPLDDSTILVGITTEKEMLRNRIVMRSDVIISTDVVNETKAAVAKYGWDGEAMTGNVYPLLRKYLSSNITFEELKEQFIARDWQLAKRQNTWFRRNPDIKWFSLHDAYTYIARELDNMNKL